MGKSRRRFLAALGATALAGCSGNGDDATGGDTTATEGRTATTSRQTTEETTQSTTAEGTERPLPTRQVKRIAPADYEGMRALGLLSALSDDGETAVITGYDQEAGAAWTFERSDGEWARTAKLIGDRVSSVEDSQFGWAVDVSGDGQTTVVGAPSDTSAGTEEAGSVYVFAKNGGEWARQTKLVVEGRGYADYFGMPVELSDDGSTLIAGATGEDRSDEQDVGAAYVFERSGSGWVRRAKLVPDGVGEYGNFGRWLAVSNDGTTAVITAPANSSSNQRGSVYVFDGSGGQWSQQAELLPGGSETTSEFGNTVGLTGDGTTALVSGNPDSVYTASGGEWTRRDSTFTPSAISDDGTTGISWSYLSDTPEGKMTGSASVSEGPVGDWTVDQTLTVDGGEKRDQFGYSASISGDGGTAVVGMRPIYPDGLYKGGAYIFE